MDLSKYRAKLIGNDEERAVSPVIGVILMVAITVILAAVIAAFVLDMGDSMGNEPVNAVASVDTANNATEAEVSIDDIGNADGIVVVASDGTPVSVNDDKILTSTGETHTYSTSDQLSTDSSFTVQAYQGELEDASESINDQTDSTTVIGEFETGS